MFTGIVRNLGIVKSVKVLQGYNRIVVEAPGLDMVREGDSIMINGACMTLVDQEESLFSFDVIEESLKLTNFGELVVGSMVNLETSLRLQDTVDGHLVTGHVDFVTRLLKINELNEYYFEINQDFAKYIALKGSVCLNGVSLTVSELTDKHFRVSLIPATIEHTNFKSMQVGDLVNVEIDLIARYLERLTSKNV